MIGNLCLLLKLSRTNNLWVNYHLVSFRHVINRFFSVKRLLTVFILALRNLFSIFKIRFCFSFVYFLSFIELYLCLNISNDLILIIMDTLLLVRDFKRFIEQGALLVVLGLSTPLLGLALDDMEASLDLAAPYEMTSFAETRMFQVQAILAIILRICFEMRVHHLILVLMFLLVIFDLATQKRLPLLVWYLFKDLVAFFIFGSLQLRNNILLKFFCEVFQIGLMIDPLRLLNGLIPAVLRPRVFAVFINFELVMIGVCVSFLQELMSSDIVQQTCHNFWVEPLRRI